MDIVTFKYIKESLRVLKEIRDTAHYESDDGICTSAKLYRLPKCVCYAMFRDWKYFSGDVGYPIPATYGCGQGYDAYYHYDNLYDRSIEYGQLRYKLIDHCIVYLTNLIAE